jgi:hypothetical protein
MEVLRLDPVPLVVLLLLAKGFSTQQGHALEFGVVEVTDLFGASVTLLAENGEYFVVAKEACSDVESLARKRLTRCKVDHSEGESLPPLGKTDESQMVIR